MWQCSKCEACQVNPKDNFEHVEKCQVKPRPMLPGWQGLKLDGIPRSQKSGLLLSEMFDEWNNIQKPQNPPE